MNIITKLRGTIVKGNGDLMLKFIKIENIYINKNIGNKGEKK